MSEKSEALRLADAIDPLTRQSLDNLTCSVAAAELRRLHAENETLRKSVARLQQHHATAWNRGHTMGMKANEDTARRALDAVKQDAWGNTQLTEALLEAEAQRDALLEALRVFVSCASPVATEIDERGHSWTEAYLDQALPIARAAIKAVEGEKA